VGGRDGAARISDMLLRLGVVPGLVLDEGGAVVSGSVPGVETPVALVGIAEKGYLSLALTAESPGGHSSMPPRNSAVGILAHAVARLEDEQMPTRLTEPVREMFSHVGPHMPFPRKLVLANLWLSRPFLERSLSGAASTNAIVRTTTAATMFTGSTKQNVLPARAAAVVNFRILPGDSRAAVMEHVTRVVDDPRVSIGTLSFSSEPSPVSPVEDGAYNLIDGTIRQALGGALEVAPYLSVGATDARYYTRLTPRVYRFLPERLAAGDLARVHGTNERIAVDNYAEMIRFYYQLIRNVNDVRG
jgi:carboxypeptidase PM20D1